MTYKLATPPNSPRSNLINSPSRSSGGSLPSSLEPPRTYFKSSPQALSAFFSTRMGSQVSSESRTSPRTPSLVHQEQDSASEGSSEGEELAELTLGARGRLFCSAEKAEGEGEGGVHLMGEHDVEEGQGKDEPPHSPNKESVNSSDTFPHLTHQKIRPLSACSSCGVTPPLSSHSHVSLLPCHHLLCSPCINQLVNGVSNGPPRAGACFSCGRLAEGFEGVEFVEQDKGEGDRKMGAVQEWMSKSMRATCGWGEGGSVTPSSPGSVRSGSYSRSSPSDLLLHGVVRIDNIPWDIKTHEIEQWIPESIRKLPDELAPISILCNRSDGRTLNMCYIELPSVEEAQKLVRMMGQGSKLRGRAVGVCLGSKQQLMEHIFPDWQPGFEGGDALEPWAEGTILSLGDIDGLVQLMSMESPHVLKAPERPFLQLATILVHLPAHQDSTYDSKLIAALVHAVEVALTTLLDIPSTILSSSEAQKLLKILLSTAMNSSALRDTQKKRLLSLVGERAEPLSPSPTSSRHSSISTPPTSPATSSLRSPTLDRVRSAPSSPSPLRRSSLVRSPSPSPATESAKRSGEMVLAFEEGTEKEGDAERLAESLGVEVDLVRKVAERLQVAL